MEQLLTIGEFAERCGLSRSALRFYDQNDLLRPQLVDEETGYRYYAIEQLEQGVLVRRLRAAEMPVGLVRQYLASVAGERRAILEVHLTAVRERTAAVEGVVDDLRSGLDAAGAHDGGRWALVAPAQFADALAQVSFAIADPAERVELSAVWVETKDDSLRLVATDSYRLAVRDVVPERIGPEALRGVIDAEPIRVLVSGLQSAASLMLSQDPAGTITAAVLERRVVIGHAGEGFPDYERILLGLPATHQIALERDAVIRALGQLGADGSALRLDFEPGRLVFQTRDRRATVAGRWSGPQLRMCVDARFFAEAVAATVGPDLVVEASDAVHPITLRSADTGTFSVLTMPIRPPDDQ
jgi:DNA polymerase-3 subunit beta